VKRAAQYDFEFSADKRFSSSVNGFGQGAIRINETAFTGDKTIPDGTYYWRVRGVTAKDQAGQWSPIRVLHKSWTDAPTLLSPLSGTIAWPTNPLVLRWTPVPHATRYDVWIATDPALSNLILGSVSSPTWTEATVAAISTALPSGTYYWAITPVDAEGNPGRRSQVSSFTWTWPSGTSTGFANTATDPGVIDPQLSWAPVPGAASYQVEVNSSQGFAAGSKLCCNDQVVGTSLTPTQFLPNEETLYWRMRALDAHGNAGDWNYGQPFQESFDQLTPTIPNLKLRDINGNELPAGSSTQTPIVTWDAVPGASSYEVQIAPYDQGAGLCNWGNVVQDVTTATTAWTAFGGGQHVGPSGWPGPEGGAGPTPGASYCFQIRARRDDSALGGGQVFSGSTQLGGPGQPAFAFSTSPNGNPGLMPASAYIQPVTGTTVNSTPLFTWNPVSNAGGYYVVVARDALFTDVIDVGFTNTTAYAPRIANNSPYVDQTTSYYWAVMPTNANGSFLSDNNPQDDNPRSFTKSSVPPNPISPGNGAAVSGVATFRWSSTQGARDYRLQVAGDPSFGKPMVDVTTDGTSFTSEAILPANQTLYWRVRANDVNGAGLNWSTTSGFAHTVPAPLPLPGNPTGGEALPVFSWTPVDGATQYDIHFVQADGTTKDFTLDGPLASWQYWYGTGIWRWQVRADFPGDVSSAYFSPEMQFVRIENPPPGAHGTKSGSRISISWNPDPNAKQYQVQLSTTDGFGSTVASDTTDNTVWVPQIDSATTAHTLYWRVATVDQGGNVGAYATGIFSAPRRATHKRACVRSKHKHCPPRKHHKRKKK
jgi:hypothetical protein